MTTQNQSIAPNNTLLTQRKSPKAILCAIALIVAGTALYLVSKLLPDNSSSLYMACLVGGMIVAFIANGSEAFKIDRAHYNAPWEMLVKARKLYLSSMQEVLLQQVTIT